MVLAAASAFTAHRAAGGVHAARIAFMLAGESLVGNRTLDVYVASPFLAVPNWRIGLVDTGQPGLARATEADVGELCFACEEPIICHCRSPVLMKRQ